MSKQLQKSIRRKSVRRRLVRYGLVTANVAILAMVVGFVWAGSRTNDTVSASYASYAATTTQPVDGLTSYDIAANVARVTSLPESTAIDNQAQSAKVAVAVSASDVTVAAKPQLVATTLKSKDDIKRYTTVAGDTATSIGQKFGVTSDSIKWSNGLTSDTVPVGKVLNIPPVNGIAYIVQSTDSIQSLATRFKVGADQITASNDAEITGIHTGELILIPNAQLSTPATAAATSTSRVLSAASFTAVYGNNGYDYGYCTYYAAARSGAPSNWGNANTWAYYAALSGWTVSSVPRVGAIAQTSAGYLGHVAIVEAVSPDGSQIKYSDMNGIAGWGRVGYSDWVPVSHFEHYIYR